MRILMTASLLGATLFFVGCGSKKEEDKPAAPTCASSAASNPSVLCVGNATTSTFQLTGGSGEQYVVAAYALGDSSVVGAGAQAFSFKITAASASLQEFRKSQNREIAPQSAALSELDRENTLRSIANRFDIRRGMNQEPWIWAALEKLDAAAVNIPSRARLKPHFASIAGQRSEILLPSRLKNRFTNTTAGNCPATAPSADGSSTIAMPTNYDGTSFCIGYPADPTGDTKENIQASVKAVVAAYKDTIYQDQMTANTKNGYSFNPLIVFVSSLAYDGAFSSTATTVGARPVIHIKASLAKAKLHATIAHEMQHAIVDYYKTRGTTNIAETVAVDEGVAHLMEDAFGYGEDNFASYVKNFLVGFPDGSAILANNDGANAAAARGGANALVYYMAVRAGGFTVTNGKPFSGPGMQAIVAMVKQTEKNGPSALAAAFGKADLTSSVGGLIGALFNDNRDLSFAPEDYKLTTYDSITDILGTTGLTFGLRFNKFRSFTGTVSTNELSAGAEIESKHYESIPILVTPTGASATVTVTLPGIANSGITVARIK